MDSDESDAELLERVTLRDREAFKRLYLRYHRRLARFLHRMTSRRETAEEIINDAMLVVWHKAGDFRRGSRVSTWIIGIAYRRALKALEREDRFRTTVGGARQDADPADPTSAIDGLEATDWLGHALDRLSIDQRAVIEMTYLQNLSCEEIASVMECPVNTVKTRMFHARAHLRRFWDEDNRGQPVARHGQPGK